MNGVEFTRGQMFVLGWQYQFAGSFMKALAEAMVKADVYNMAQLGRGFPEEVAAMNAYQNIDGWWLNLQKRYLAMLPVDTAKISLEDDNNGQ